MTRSLIILMLFLVGLSATGQAQADNFKNLNDSSFLVSCFQMDVIEKGELKDAFSTIIMGGHYSPVIVYQTFHENCEEGYGDPVCIWLNKSTIDTIPEIKWIKFTELREEGKWVYLSMLLLEKKDSQIQIKAFYKYKIRTAKIGLGPKNYFKKIKVIKYMPEESIIYSE